MSTVSNPSLKKSDGLQHELSATSSAVLISLPRQPHSHLVSGDLSKSHDRLRKDLTGVSPLTTSDGNDP